MWVSDTEKFQLNYNYSSNFSITIIIIIKIAQI